MFSSLIKVIRNKKKKTNKKIVRCHKDAIMDMMKGPDWRCSDSVSNSAADCHALCFFCCCCFFNGFGGYGGGTQEGAASV